jgi:hypothetical protein
MFSECGSAICIDFDVACDLSCPEPDTCVSLDSNPPQLDCAGRIAPQGQPMPAPPNASDAGMPSPPATQDAGGTPGIDCSAHPVCGIDGNYACAEPLETCLAAGCATPVCIRESQACSESCPNPAECTILENVPGGLTCPGRVDGYNQDVAVDAGSSITVVDAGSSVASCDGAACVAPESDAAPR